MKKETISDKQGISIITLFMFGSTLVAGAGGEAKQDVWLSILLGYLFALPINLIYARLHSLFPENDLFDILQLLFGKIIGKLISLIFIWFAFHLGALVLRNFSELIFVMSMPETPQLVMLILMCLLCIYIVREGIEVFGRWAELFVFIIVPLAYSLMLLAIPQMDFNNITPFLLNGITPVLKGAFGAFSFPFAETIIFTMVFTNLNDKNSSYRIYPLGITLGGMVILAATTRNILVLGADPASRSYFSSYIAVARINIADFLQRLETLTVFIFTGAALVKISACLLAASKGIGKFFNKPDYRFAVLPAGIIMVIVALKIYSNTKEMVDWGVNVWRYYAFPFQVILPLIIWFFAEIKAASHRKKKENKAYD